MNIAEGLREALDTVVHNKLRTFLTMLGMFIGVAAVIAIISSGMMARQSIMGSVDSLGAGLFWVVPHREAYEAAEESRTTAMVPEDLEAIESMLGDQVLMNPVLEGYETFSRQGYSGNQQVYGIEENYWKIWQLKIDRGRGMTPEELASHQKVAVIGPDIAARYFGDGEDPVGRMLSIGGRFFTVIGVTAIRERSFMSDGSGDGTAYIPYSVYQSMFDWSAYAGKTQLWFFSAKLLDPSFQDEAFRLIDTYLDARYGLLAGQSRFTINTPEENQETFDRIFSLITTVISLIAGISLLVSGIGIMNIMLVTVSERTREIGVRKAIGARNRDILSQFLIETIFVCLLGGGIGVLLGMGIAWAIAFFQQWIFQVPLFAILIGLGVSAGIGLISGIYPAMKAAVLPPVIALTKD